MPLIADPGYALSRDAAEAGFPVTCAPGASAVTTALTLAGLPTDRFLFAGFLPNASGQRKSALSELGAVQATLVLYESPKRVGALLADAQAVLGPDRSAAVCRELTKKFEEVRRGTLGELAAQYAGQTVKGEVVVLVDRAASQEADENAVKEALVRALESMRVKDASESVARATGWPKRKVYQLALDLAGKR